MNYVNKYSLKITEWEKIGEGRCGEVYRVTNLKTGEISAIKKIKIDPEEVIFISFFFVFFFFKYKYIRQFCERNREYLLQHYVKSALWYK